MNYDSRIVNERRENKKRELSELFTEEKSDLII